MGGRLVDVRVERRPDHRDRPSPHRPCRRGRGRQAPQRPDPRPARSPHPPRRPGRRRAASVRRPAGRDERARPRGRPAAGPTGRWPTASGCRRSATTSRWTEPLDRRAARRCRRRPAESGCSAAPAASGCWAGGDAKWSAPTRRRAVPASSRTTPGGPPGGYAASTAGSTSGFPLPGARPRPIGRRLAQYGVTSVTDASPVVSIDDLAAGRRRRHSRHAAAAGRRHRCAPPRRRRLPVPLAVGPVKLVIATTPCPHSTTSSAGSRRPTPPAGRWRSTVSPRRAPRSPSTPATGPASAPGDRIEHGSVVPPDLRSVVAARGLVVVTQPGFVVERGDRYLAEVDADEAAPPVPLPRPHGRAGIPVGGGTDTPFGHPRPVAGHRRRGRAPHLHRRTPGPPRGGGRPSGRWRCSSPRSTTPAASPVRSRSAPPPTCASSRARCPGRWRSRRRSRCA